MVSTWTKIVNNAAFSARDEARCFEHNGLIFLAHGYQLGGIATNDMWRTADGSIFVSVNPSLPAKDYAPVCSHGGFIYLVDDVGVYKSTNGASFTNVGVGPGYFPNNYMVSFNGKLCLIGDNAYTSVDGTSWATTALPFPTRENFAVNVFNGRLYVMGGSIPVPNVPPEIGYPTYTSLNSVWSTNDPENPAAWVNHGNAGWAPRMWPTTVVHAGWLYLMGGYNNNYTNPLIKNFSDTWRFNGSTWQSKGMSTAYVQRHAPGSYSHRGSMYIVAGNTNVGTSVQNDVWKASDMVTGLTNEEITVLMGIY